MSVVGQILARDRSSGFICYLILTKLAHNLYHHKISVKFDNRPDPTMGARVMAPEKLKNAHFGLFSTIVSSFLF